MSHLPERSVAMRNLFQSRWFASLGGFTLLGLFFSARNVLAYVAQRQPVPWGRAVFFEMTYWLVWALLLPFVTGAASRYRMEGESKFRNVAIHFGVAAVLVPVQVALTYLAQLAGLAVLGRLPANQVPERLLNLKASAGAGAANSMLVYWVAVGVCHALRYYRLYREQKLQTAELELKTSQLKVQLAKAQLDALRSQLHPHFLFNTLNTVSVLMREDVEKANRVLLRLGELLRVSLESAGAQEVPLRQELAVLERYLEIEQIRFEERLKVSFDVDPGALDAGVPHLILQPLVENAIRYAVAPRARGGRLEIHARSNNGLLFLEISDDGPGIAGSIEGAGSAGIGLANTRARLARLYGNEHHFELKNRTGGGLSASITIPYRPCPEPEAENGKDGGRKNAAAHRG